MERLGAYTADRASALSGVPKSTIHYWDRTGVLKPGVSRSKTKLWSYADLMGLRVIYWLRSRKDEPDGVAIPPSSMGAVRAALLQLEAFDVELWAKDAGAGLSVDRAGRIVVNPKDSAPVINWQMLLGIDVIELTGPFPTKSGSFGPDLREPRPRLRIVPGKLGGAPHITETRIETESLAALSHRGFRVPDLLEMYPGLSARDVDEALDLEAQLERNLHRSPIAA